MKTGAAYTAYYACRSGSLASLEPAALDWKLPGLAEHLKDLGELFEFDAVDLDANRSGNINFGQLPFGDIAGALFFVALFATPGLACILERREKRTLSVIGFCLVSGLLGAGMLYANRGLFQDLAEQRSCSWAGTLTDVSTRYSKNTSYWQLTIADKTIEFPHPDRSSSLLRVGSGYRLHFLCHSEELLSIEPLS